MRVELERTWELGEIIGSGGFGNVYEAASEGMPACVAKLVPQDKGADRELLFVDLTDVRNVVPIIDSGETGEQWVLIMPRAEFSLRDRLGEVITVDDTVAVISDVAKALADLDGRVVHRDIKPENTLLLDGHWCLADFGISRYAEATTAPDTRKHALSPPYAAPERWRAERATISTDVYSLGVMAYEMLSGTLPFDGTTEDLRDAHVSQEPQRLEGIAPNLAALVSQCLYKAPGSRPSPEDIVNRLQTIDAAPESAGLARLQAANLQEVGRQGEIDRQISIQRSAENQRADLRQDARRAFEDISSGLYQAIAASASAPAIQAGGRSMWPIQLGDATLEIRSVGNTPESPWVWSETPSFDVIAHSNISLRIPPKYSYEGRSHSLWYCDAQEEGRYQWFELAFMVTPGVPRRGIQNPFALDPGEEAAKALWVGMAEFQMAWPLEVLNADTMGAFIDRWAGWFADAVEGRLAHPGRMPERDPKGSWRRN